MDEDDGFRTTPTSPEKALLRFAGDHITLLASVAAATIFAIRCIIVTHGDHYTAAVLLAQTSLGDAVRVLLFWAAPVLLLVSSLVLAIMALNQEEWWSGATLGLGTISVLTYIVGAYLSRSLVWWRVAVWVFLILFIAFWLKMGKTRNGSSLSSMWSLERLSIAAIAPTLVVLILLINFLHNDDFWLPPERLSFRGEAPFTGYVLRSNDDYFVIMNDNPRVIVEKPKSSLLDRDLCYHDDPELRTSKTVRSNIPVCP
jgi:hypothetical protein